jgi:hypothetical protein
VKGLAARAEHSPLSGLSEPALAASGPETNRRKPPNPLTRRTVNFVVRSPQTVVVAFVGRKVTPLVARTVAVAVPSSGVETVNVRVFAPPRLKRPG